MSQPRKMSSHTMEFFYQDHPYQRHLPFSLSGAGQQKCHPATLEEPHVPAALLVALDLSLAGTLHRLSPSQPLDPGKTQGGHHGAFT